MSSAARLREDLWVSRTTSPLITVVLVYAAIRQILPPGDRRPTPVRAVVTAIAAAMLGTCRVVASREGVTVGLGPWGQPSMRIARADIEMVESTLGTPVAFGGWGLRWRPGQWGLILRRGPALRITLARGTELVVSTDDPDGAIGALGLDHDET